MLLLTVLVVGTALLGLLALSIWAGQSVGESVINHG